MWLKQALPHTAAVDHEKHVDSKQNKGMQTNQVTKKERDKHDKNENTSRDQDKDSLTMT